MRRLAVLTLRQVHMSFEYISFLTHGDEVSWVLKSLPLLNISLIFSENTILEEQPNDYF
jgi:hypothetical protein